MWFNHEKSIWIRAAYIISRMTEPFLLLAILGLVIVFSGYFDGFDRVWWAIGLAVILGLLPLATLWLGVKKIKKIDIDFTKKETRTPFILIILFYWIIGVVLAWGLRAPGVVIGLILVAIIINILVLVINFYWKVSNHSLMATAVPLFINQFFGWDYWWLFFIVPVVIWARWIQKKHTLGQLAVGVVLGILAGRLLALLGY